MIRAVYEPAVPALSLRGHAGYVKTGGDIVCAAASMLMYALMEAVREEAPAPGPGGSPAVSPERKGGGDGAQGGAQGGANLFNLRGTEAGREAFRVVAGGFRLLAENFPENVCFEVRE